MASYRVACVNEEKRPLAGVVVEAVSLNSWPTVSSTATTGRNGTVQFTGLSGPHWFRPRVRRTSATVGGRNFTGAVEIQVVGLGESMNVDYVVDTAGLGTHTTLATALVSAITDAGVSGSKTIWLCKSITESALAIAGLGTSANITIASHSQFSVVITANTNEDIFTQASNGGNIAGGLHFRNVGFSIPSANRAIYDVNTGSEISQLHFDECNFDLTTNGYLARQDGNDSLGAIDLEVRNCTGTAAGFFDVAGASSTFGPDNMRVYGGRLALTALWDGGSENACPDQTSLFSSTLTLTNGITFGNSTTEQRFGDLFINFAAASALFTTGGAMQSCEDFSFQSITVRFGHADGTFCDFGSNNINPGDGLFFDSIFGYPANGVGAGGTFITVDTDWVNVHVGNIFGKDFVTQYSGSPSGAPETLLVVAKSGAYTLTSEDGLVIADASGGTFTLTLPTAVGITGTVYRVKKIDATANVVTIDADGAETIDGATTATLTTQYEAITVISDGTEWWVL